MGVAKDEGSDNDQSGFHALTAALSAQLAGEPLTVDDSPEPERPDALRFDDSQNFGDMDQDAIDDQAPAPAPAPPALESQQIEDGPPPPSQ